MVEVRNGRTGAERLVTALLQHGASEATAWHQDVVGLDRTELARRAQLTRQSVHNLLHRTAINRLVLTEWAGQGRHVALDPRLGAAVGCDLSPSGARVGLGDLQAQLFEASRTFERSAESSLGAHDVLDWVAHAIESLLAESETAADRLVGIGISVAAPLEYVRARIHPSGLTAPSWRGLHVADELRRRLRYGRVWCEADTDARLSALAEYMWGAARAKPDVVYVKWSDRICAGLILDGSLYRGSRGFAGEIGHVLVGDLHGDGARCPRCGNVGCLEMAAGARRLWELLGRPGDPTRYGEEILNLAERENGASELLGRAATAIGTVLGGVVTLLESGTIVLGGSLGTQGFSRVAGAVRVALEENATPFTSDIEILGSALPSRTALRGAVLWALQRNLASFLHHASETR